MEYNFITIFLVILIIIPSWTFLYLEYRKYKNMQEQLKSLGSPGNFSLKLDFPEEKTKSYRWRGGQGLELESKYFDRSKGYHLKDEPIKDTSEKEKDLHIVPTSDISKNPGLKMINYSKCSQRDKCPQCGNAAVRRIYFCQHADSKCSNNHIWHYADAIDSEFHSQKYVAGVRISEKTNFSYDNGDVDSTKSLYLSGKKKNGACPVCQGKRNWYPLVPKGTPIYKHLPVTEKAIRKYVPKIRISASETRKLSPKNVKTQVTLISPGISLISRKDDEHSSLEESQCPTCGLESRKLNKKCGCSTCSNMHKWHNEKSLGIIMMECPQCLYENKRI
jgi:hypothetical protein